MEERRIKVITEYSLNQPLSELSKLEVASEAAKKEIKEINKALKETDDTAKKEELSTALKKAKEAAKTADDQIKMMQNSVNLSSMNYNQLSNYVNRLTKELKGTTEGTVAYNKVLAQLEPAKALFEQKKEVMSALGKEVDKGTTSFGRMKDIIMGTFGGNVLFNALESVVGGVKNFFSSAVGNFMDFEVALKAVKAEVQPTAQQMEKLKQQAMEVGPQFGKTAKDMMDAYNVVGSGMSELIDTEGALEKVTEAAMRLSIVGEMNLEPAAATVTESLSQFQAGAEEASKYIDIMATGSQVGAAKISEISSSLRYVGPVAAAANVSFLETNAALQILSTTGRKGEQAGTDLRNVLLKLATSTDTSINPSVVGLSKALENLKAKNLGVTATTKMFGEVGFTAVSTLLANVPKLKAWTAEIDKGGGAAGMFADKTDTLRFKVDAAKASITNKAVALGESLAPAIIKTITAGLAFIDIITSIPKWLSENKETLIGLTAAVVALDLSLASSNLKLLASAAATKGKIAWDTAATIATNLFAVAQRGLNAVVSANPIGLLVTALIALGTYLYTSSQYSDSFKKSINSLFAYVKEGIKIFVEFHKALFSLDFSKAADLILNSFSRMSGAATKSLAQAKVASDQSVKGLKEQAKTKEATTETVIQKTQEELAAEQEAAKKKEEASKKAAEAAKKAAEERKKANEDALKAIAEMEKDFYIASIRRKDGDYAAEVAKLTKEHQAARKAIEESKAIKALKDKQIEALDKLHKQRLEDLAEDARQKESDLVDKWLAEESSTKLRKLQESYNKELAQARKTIQDKEKLIQVEAALQIWLSAERKKVQDEEHEKSLKKLSEHLNKRLANEKLILEAEKTATLNIYKQKEIIAGSNAKKRIAVEQERAKAEYDIAIKYLEYELRASKEKLDTEVLNQDQRNSRIKDLDAKFAEDTKAKYLDLQKNLTKIQDDAQKDRLKKKEAAINGFTALLKFDFNQAMNHFSTLAEGKKGQVLKVSEETLAYVEAAGKAAIAGIEFLNNLAQESAKARLASLEQIHKQELASLQANLAASEAAVAESQAAIEALRNNHSTLVLNVNREEKQKIADLNALHSDILRQGAEFDFQDAVTKSATTRDTKIADANTTAQEQMRAANDVKNEQIITADASLAAFTQHTLSRQDLSEQEKQSLIAAAQATRDSKITEATAAYNTSLELSALERDQKLLDAEAEHQRKLELMDALKEADHERAEDLIKLAEEEKEKKLDLVEEEKNEKLKKLAEENEKRKLEKDDLDRELAQKEKDYRLEKYKIELDAWKRQQKADIAMAVTNGAIASVKALASGFFPLNLGFAATIAGLTLVQVNKIKKQTPPEAPSFAFGTDRVSRRLGGIAQGPSHGTRYGQSGIALINRQTGQEVGEMEGNEAIIPASQTKANRPLILQMLANARRNPHQSITQPSYRLGGFLLPPAPKLSFAYGTENLEQEYSEGSGSSLSSDAAYQEAKAQGQTQLKLLQEIVSAVQLLDNNASRLLSDISSSTAANVSATNNLGGIMQSLDARGTLNSIMDKLRSLG